MAKQLEELFEDLDLVDRNNELRDQLQEKLFTKAQIAIEKLDPENDGLSKSDAKLNVVKTTLDIMKNSEEATMKRVKLNLQNNSVQQDGAISTAVVDLLNRASTDMIIPTPEGMMDEVSDEDLDKAFKELECDEITEGELEIVSKEV